MKLFAVLSLVFISHIIAFAGDPLMYPVSEIPENLRKGASAVVREDVGRFEVKSPSEARKFMRMVVTVFKDDQPFEYFRMGYDKFTKIKNIKAQYYNAEGKLIRKVTKEEIVDRAAFDGFSVLTDNRIKTIENKYGVYPYTFAIEWEEEQTATFQYDPWSFQSHFNVAVQHSEYTVTLPKDMKLFHRVLNADLKPVISNSDKLVEYKWVLENLPIIKKEPLRPDVREIFPQLELAPSSFSYDNWKGDMISWSNLGKADYTLNKDRDILSVDMAVQVNNMIAKAKTNREKIDTLYRYMQKNMRYVSIQLGIGGWQTFDAQYVGKNKYGDCKALSNFMRAMLREVKIPANLVSISAGADDFYNPDSSFCNPRFNHMILYVPSENMWLECTSDLNPTGYMGAFTQNRNALVEYESGGVLMHTPVYSSKDNVRSLTSEIKIDETGAAKFKNQKTETGVLQDRMRYDIKNLSKEDYQKHFTESVHIPYSTIENFTTDVRPDTPLVSLNYNVSVEKYASKTGTRLFIPVNTQNAFSNTPAATDKRILSVEISEPDYSERDEVTFILPDGYDIEAMNTEVVEIKSDYGNYKSQLERVGNNVVYKRTLEIKQVKLPAEKFNELRDFYKKIQQADYTKIILKKRS